MFTKRIGRKPDMQRLGEGLSRPGMDTRCWTYLAKVIAFELRDEDGAFADVERLDTGEQETVRVGAFYEGPGFGFYAPLDKDDEVLVSVPGGDPDQGGVIVARLWSHADQPSSTAKDNNTDVSLHIKSGKNLRIAVAGGGKVLLGEAGADTKAVARATDPLTASGAMAAWASIVEAGVNAAIPGSFTPANNFAGPPGAPTPTNPGKAGNFGDIESGSDDVEASD